MGSGDVTYVGFSVTQKSSLVLIKRSNTQPIDSWIWWVTRLNGVSKCFEPLTRLLYPILSDSDGDGDNDDNNDDGDFVERGYVSAATHAHCICLQLHLSLKRESRWGTTDDFTTSSLHFFFFLLFCTPLPAETWRTPGLFIPKRCLPTSFSVCLVFFPLSLCFTRWFWPDLMNGRHVKAPTSSGHISVCISLPS